MKMKKMIFGIMLASTIAVNAYATPPMNIACAKNKVVAYYTSGEYEKDVDQLVKPAEAFLFSKINDSKYLKQPKKLAIVLDIDDTSLSNFKVNQVDDFSNIEALINKRYEKANSPAVKPVRRLYDEAIANGVAVFFITFRPQDVRGYTVTNLKNEGYGKWNALYMPSADELKQPSRVFKTRLRKMLTEEGYDIVLNLGDQTSDLEGGYSDYTVKIPNPMYTSAASCETNSKTNQPSCR